MPRAGGEPGPWHEGPAQGGEAEALDGAYAFPDEIWTELVGFPPERIQAVLDDVMRLLDA